MNDQTNGPRLPEDEFSDQPTSTDVNSSSEALAAAVGFITEFNENVQIFGAIASSLVVIDFIMVILESHEHSITDLRGNINALAKIIDRLNDAPKTGRSVNVGSDRYGYGPSIVESLDG